MFRPTMELKWYRIEDFPLDKLIVEGFTVHGDPQQSGQSFKYRGRFILRQWWVNDSPGEIAGEWRDVEVAGI